MKRGRQFIINFHDQEGFLTENKSLSLKDLNLPSSTKRFHNAAHWIIEVLKFNDSEKKVYAKVISYNLNHLEFTQFSSEEQDQIENLKSVVFNELSTLGLFQTAGKLGQTVSEATYLKNEKLQMDRLHQKTLKLKESIRFPITNLNFKLGAVVFKHKFKDFESEVLVEVPNEHLREEFDAIKNYFTKILKTKQIVVKAEIEIVEGAITFSNNRSKQIDKITPELIESVKFEFIRGFSKNKPPFEIDKSLFTMEEYFQQYDPDSKGNPFYNDEQSLFDDILNISKSKHYRQLRYLSQQHASHLMKLRFIQQPFSFIFLLEGEQKYHVVWETLNTKEATYIWHSEKNIAQLKRTLQKVEDIIKVVKVQGKIAYITSSEENYKRVFHDYSDIKDGFLTWKNEFESYLT